MNNIIKDDFIMSKDGRKLYKAYCLACGADRGYIRCRDSGKLCRTCCAKNKNYNHLFKKDVREKAIESLVKRQDLDHSDVIVHESGGRRYAHRCEKCNNKHYISSGSKITKCRECYLLETSTRDNIRHKIKQNMRSNLNHRLKDRGIKKGGINI